MDKKTRAKFFVSLSITFSLAILIFFFIPTKTYQILELKALDVRFTLRGNIPARGPVVHIDIDDRSLEKVGRWPWPRSYHAKLTALLKECGAKQILWDVIFSEEFKDNPQEDVILTDAIYRSAITYFPFYFNEPQAYPFPKLKEMLLKDIALSAENAAKALGVNIGLVRDKLTQAKRMLLEEVTHDFIRQKPDISFDELLGEMEKVYGWYLFAEDESFVQERFAHQKLLDFFVNRYAVDFPIQSWPFKKNAGALNVPIMAFSESMKGSGFINADPDIDGVTRKVPLFVRYEDKILPQLTIAALLDRLEVKEIQVTPEQIVLKNARFHPGRKDIVIPVDKQGCMLVNWHGTWESTFHHIPYYLILQLYEVRQQLAALQNPAEKQTDPQGAKPSGDLEFLKKTEKELMGKLVGLVKDKICLVGLTATGTHDLRPIPIQENFPMVGTHSNIINTILTEKFITRQSNSMRLLIFLFSALVISLASMTNLWKNLSIALGYAVGFFLLSYYLFVHRGLWIDLVGPLGIVVFGFASITSFRFFTEEKEKLWIKHAFSHYLSNEVINEMLADPSKLKLGGERRLITVMFSDVRGFTSFSESHEPEEVVAMLNQILTEQVKVIFQYSGTLDKFVGDEVMAFFGAPGNKHINDHALVAVRTAIEIQEKMRELREKWSTEKKQALQIGIGINTGDMVVGNMGSADRMDYTIIGDNVNLGARLCSAASKDEIIISESTYNMVSGQINVEKLEPISVKGKSKPISIYRVIGLK